MNHDVSSQMVLLSPCNFSVLCLQKKQ